MIKKSDIKHYNRWLTARIQNYVKNLDDDIKYLFEPHISFKKMSKFFGLWTGYLPHMRCEVKAKSKISENYLKIMRDCLRENIEKWIKMYPTLAEKLLKTYSDIIYFIDEYSIILKPPPFPNYQMYRFHPNFIRDYFANISSKEQAYWLGFLFADGYISIEHKKARDYYRMGITLGRKDRDFLAKFCKSIGLNPKFISDERSRSDFSDKMYDISRIRWGDQKMAQDLINLGMEYEFREQKGRRVKVPILPDLGKRALMLAFLLGFRDGDGTLHLTKYETIRPILFSSNKEFLIAIKKHFYIEYNLCERILERINPRSGIMIETPYHSLALEVSLFKEMLDNYKNSLKRKRVDEGFFKDYFLSGEKMEIHFNQIKWLKQVIKIEDLKQMLEVLSLYRISRKLGVTKNSLIKVAEDYNVKNDYGRGYYISINNLIRAHGENSEYHKTYQYWLDHLRNIGKFKEQ